MKQLTTILTIMLSLNCFGQSKFDNTKISSQTQQIVMKIESVNEVMDRAVGYAGIRPKQFDNFTDLQKKATKDELMELTNYPNGVVRCYAFWALSYDSTASLFPFIINHLNDTTQVEIQFGCIGSKEKVGDFFIEVITPHYVDLDSKKLNESELTTLDSILIYTPNKLYAREKAINRIKLNENVYLKAKELVLKENSQSALVTLAKFQEEQDISIILKNKVGSEPDDGYFFTYKAIIEFPNPAFLPLLKKNLNETLDDTHYDNEWGELYKAIASYKNDTALKLLKIPFTQLKHLDIREYHMEHVFNAIQSYYTPLYDELLWKLWENEKLINPEVFKMLYQKNPERAFEITKKTIKNADDFYYLSTNDYSYSNQNKINLIDIILDTIIKQDKVLAVKLINEKLKEINVHEFSTFADKAFRLKDSSFVTSLFSRLENESNAYVYLKATEILIAFKDEKINEQIIKVSKSNPSLRTDWGGQAFSKLLKENGIK